MWRGDRNEVLDGDSNPAPAHRALAGQPGQGLPGGRDHAVVARHWPSIAASAVGLLAILAAAGYDAGFVRDGTNSASLGMALATGVALLCYIIGLFVASRPAPARPA